MHRLPTAFTKERVCFGHLEAYICATDGDSLHSVALCGLRLFLLRSLLFLVIPLTIWPLRFVVVCAAPLER
jgi:hypothetical protein